MKIMSVEILGFGKWANYSTSLDSQLTLFFGGNEAGKSTLYQFIRTMLFGFPGKRGKVKDYEPKDGQTYGGRLVIEKAPYGQIIIERIKSRNNGKARVLLADGQSGEEQLLQQVLAPLTKELFDEIFAFQQEQLPNIENLDEQQLQNLLLTIGLTGSQRLLEQQGAFNLAQQKIYKPNGRNPILNKKIEDYRYLEQQIKSRERLEQNYQMLQKQLVITQQEQADNRQNMEQTQKNLILLKQQAERWSLYLEQQDLGLQQKAQAQVLPEELVHKLSKNYQKYEFFISEKKRLTNVGLHQKQASNASPALLFYLQQEEKIQKVLSDQVAVERLSQQLEWLTKSGQEKKQEQERLTTIYQWDKALIDQINQTVVEEIQELAKVQTQLNDQESRLSDQLQQLRIQETEVEAELNWLEEQTPAPASKPFNQGIWFMVTSGLGIALWVIAKLSGWPWLGVWVFLALVLISSVPVIKGLQRGRNPKNNSLKERWQAKLSQLDWLKSQIADQMTLWDKSQQEQATYLARYQKMTRNYGLSNQQSPKQWLDSLGEVQRFQEIARELAKGRQEQVLIQKELDVYQSEVVFLQEWLPLSNLAREEQYQRIQVFAKEMAFQKQSLNQNEQGPMKWLTDLKDIESRENELLHELAPILSQIGLVSLDEIPQVLTHQENNVKNAQRLKELTRGLANTFVQNQDYQLEEIEGEITEKEQRLSDYERHYQELLKVEQKDRYEVRMMEQDGTLASLYQEQANQLSEIQSLLGEWIENRLAEKIIQDILQFLSEQQLPALLATATAYFKILTAGEYLKCFLSDNQLQVRHRNGQTYLLKELSTGTRDQVYLALRLAFIQLHSQECSAPVIIDDGWLHFDQQRKQALFELFAQFSQQVQVICFSSDREILAYFKQKDWPLIVLERGE